MLFSKGKGNSMQELLLEHARSVLDSVDNFQSMVEALRLLDFEKARKYEGMVEKFETIAGRRLYVLNSTSRLIDLPPTRLAPW